MDSGVREMKPGYLLLLLTVFFLSGCSSSSVVPAVDIGVTPTGYIYTNAGADVDVDDIIDQSTALEQCKERGFDDVRTYRRLQRNCHVGITTGLNCRVRRVVVEHECVAKEDLLEAPTADEVVLTLTVDRPIPLTVFAEPDIMACLREDHKSIVDAAVENAAVQAAALASCRSTNVNVDLVTPLETDVVCLKRGETTCLEYEFQRRFRCTDTMSAFFDRG